MPVNVKYQQICAELKQRIADGCYTDRLPPRRQLMQEFAVSSRTLHKVFTELKNCGCIEPDNQGTRLSAMALSRSNRPVRIVLVSANIETIYTVDPIIQPLVQSIKAAGFELRLCDPLQSNVLECFQQADLSGDDGVIFIYSSFSTAAVEYLQKRHIPFVSTNRPPDDVRINWVDWDHIELFNEFIGNLVMQGMRSLDIFWSFKSCLERDNHASIIAEFRAVKRSYSLFNSELDNFPLKDCGNIEKYVEHLCSLKKLPEVVWVVDDSRKKLVEEFNKRGIYDTGFLITHDRSRAQENSVAVYSTQAYRHLADKAWNLLCHVRRHPDGAPRGIKQRCVVKFCDFSDRRRNNKSIQYK